MAMTPRPSSAASAEEVGTWRTRRAQVGDAVRALGAQGVCFQCRDQETAGEILGEQVVVHEDEDVRVVLALDPRVPGHTVVVWKQHAHDFTELDDDDSAKLAIVCRDVARAVRSALEGVERVYTVSMCDGPVNHLHVQLIPRYAGTSIGSARLLDERGPLVDGPEIGAAIRSAYVQGSRTS